ncbi:MAG: flagellar hook-basal body complex protein FliE [Armatimonadota bacterium]|nr:flagellar hook-basal body complex protein FliE [Armatimonadota bacterium]
MRITAISAQTISPPVLGAERANPAQGSSFGGAVKNAISKVNEAQQTADSLATKLAAGDAVEIHQTMIAMQKASTALQFTIQVRNKVIEAYQEIMRMQV